MNCSSLIEGDPNAFGCELQELGQMTSGFLGNIDPVVSFLFIIFITAFVVIVFLAGSRAIGIR